MTAVPTAPAVRAALRRSRRTHSDRTLGDLLTDVYLLAFVAVLYGGGAAVSIRRHLAQPPAGPAGTATLRGWLVLGLAVTVAALLWHGLRTLGPLVTTPPVQAWILATPVDRAAWLRTPLVALLVLAAIVGACVGVLAEWAGASAVARSTADTLASAALAGAGAGVSLAAGAVVLQPRPRTADRWVQLAVLGLGLGVVALVVVSRHAGLAGPALGVPDWLVAALTGTAAIVLGRQAAVTVHRLDRAALGAGAQLATAAVTALIMLDPSLLSGIVGANRWRLAGTVHSRHFRPGGLRSVLLQADLLRQARRRADVFAYAALVLAPYAVAVFAPIATGPIRVVAAYLAVERLAGGLRTVARSAVLRRSLGGSDAELRLIHLVVPGLGLLIWWFATSWCGAASPPVITVLLVLGILGAVYRTATRPPMSYGADLADSPLGPVPTTLLRRLVRGPDLVAILVLLDLFTSAGLR